MEYTIVTTQVEQMLAQISPRCKVIIEDNQRRPEFLFPPTDQFHQSTIVEKRGNQYLYPLIHYLLSLYRLSTELKCSSNCVLSAYTHLMVAYGASFLKGPPLSVLAHNGQNLSLLSRLEEDLSNQHSHIHLGERKSLGNPVWL